MCQTDRNNCPVRAANPFGGELKKESTNDADQCSKTSENDGKGKIKTDTHMLLMVSIFPDGQHCLVQGPRIKKISYCRLGLLFWEFVVPVLSLPYFSFPLLVIAPLSSLLPFFPHAQEREKK